MHRLDFEPTSGLPRLLWVATMRRDDDRVAVRHGPWVETCATGFVEGAWDGDFAASRPVDALVLAGTAGAVEGDAVVFATPTHTLDRLQSIARGDRLFVSNSLALLLAAAGEEVDPTYRYYMHDFATIMRGIRDHAPFIPTRGGNRARLHYHCSLAIGRDLAIDVRPKPAPPHFADYAAYRDFLAAKVRAVVDNARAPQRRIAYAPLVGISSGYDSPAAAVLAREAGATDAFSFTRARPRPGIADDDSGTAIGEHLGYAVRECDRDLYRARTDRPEIEFLATGTGGDVVMLSSIEDLLERRIFITGDHGDTAWDKDSPRVSREIKRGDPGSALADFRGRVGFLQLPVPFIGIVNHPDIDAISNSDAMRRWSLGRNRYDRPIARRIAEEQGIAREAFGQHKRAIAQTFHPTTDGPEPLAEMLSPPALRDFEAFYAALPASVRGRGAFVAAQLHRAFRLNHRLRRLSRRAAHALGLSVAFPHVVNERHALEPAPNDFTFHWAIGEMIRRYRALLAAEPAAEDGGAAALRQSPAPVEPPRTGPR